MENIIDHVGYRIILYPTTDQINIFNKYFEVCRFVYNLGIDLEKEAYTTPNKFLSFYDLNNKFTYLKNNTEQYKWLQYYDSTTLKLILNDVINAYDMFFKNINSYPAYKDIYTPKQFPIRAERVTIDKNNVYIPSIGYVKYYNTYGNKIIGSGNKDKTSTNYIKYCNTRVSFDGLYYYLSFTIPIDNNYNINSYNYYGGNEEWCNREYTDIIGIDVGLRHDKWIKDSVGNVIERPDSEVYYKKLNRLNNKLARQQKQNPGRVTKNMIKTKEKINKYSKRITNRRRASVYEYSKQLLELKPEAVVMETISLDDMTLHKDTRKTIDQMNGINKQIQDAALYDSMRIIEYKLKNNGINVIHADPQYPSSQICSRCGYRQNIGRSKYYRCPNCGLIIDRDLNAAINLANYGKEKLK